MFIEGTAESTFAKILQLEQKTYGNIVPLEGYGSALKIGQTKA